jgi:sarcosine oxidase
VAGDRIRIRAGDRELSAGHVVIAAGSWLGSLFPDLQLPLTVERQVLVWFPVGDPGPYRPDRFPVFGYEEANGSIRYGFPTLDGATIKVAVHHEGVTTDPETVDRRVHPGDVAPLAEFVGRRLTGVGQEPTRSKVCLYTNTPDQHFIADHHPDSGRITLLGGFSGHGFKFASVMGEIAADLALNGATERPIDFFSLKRFENPDMT